jgi:hypothetical protein
MNGIENHTLVHIVKYSVDLSQQEITQPFSLVPPTPIKPTTSLVESEHSDRYSSSFSDLDHSKGLE